ncbi:hypothetical protein BRARA_B01567 [Brassica rapa]|uniref:Defensin-like protein n=2 Tax=Brassica TaxID=3705 RepID=A0A078FTB5_BRANA|nr:hypothetical protein BRARA_B01567 [Brassica rapa]CAF2138207.1 unnamed protein product [Brassica napus]CAG7892786.1 unnamed protein product [Brassica rapa]CDY16331.1 BnaA02g11350D [Brassica napus]VDC87413.1 unnamed protein product [Brassica rapa]
MAKTAFSLVLPIIFIVMFCLVDENMGCGQYIGPCPVRGTCDQVCKAQFGPKADGICDFTGTKRCACKYPCMTDKTRI